MALVIKDMKLMNSADGFNVYHYTTSDTLANIAAAKYFNDFFEQLNVGDLIFATAGLGGTVATQHYVVSASSSSGVTIAASA